MRLIISRHAKAQANWIKTDALRPLSSEGVATQKALAAKLKQEGLSCQYILHSPMERARQTAEVLQEYLGGTLEKEPYLSYDFSEECLLARLNSMEIGVSVALVGHAPYLHAFAFSLAHQEDKPALEMPFSTSCGCVLDFDEEVSSGRGRLDRRFFPT